MSIEQPHTDQTPQTCRECDIELGAGYLCDDCDTVEGWPVSLG